MKTFCWDNFLNEIARQQIKGFKFKALKTVRFGILVEIYLAENSKRSRESWKF